MKPSPNTMAFVREWLKGNYKKRQYQNWYTVKTEHAQFLMKLTEDRELMAIKDNSGHVYVWSEGGATIYTNEMRLRNKEPNPLLWILNEGFPCPFTMVTPWTSSLDIHNENDPRNSISKWRVCDRQTIQHEKGRVYISLIAIGDKRFTILPKTGEVAPTIPLLDWVNYRDEAKYEYESKFVNHRIARSKDNAESLKSLRQAYVDLAGDKLDASAVIGSRWVIIPTEFMAESDITGVCYRDIRKTRPNPANFGISPIDIDYNVAAFRYATTEENIGVTLNVLKHPVANANHWRMELSQRVNKATYDAIIEFLKADDAWLIENCEAVVALKHEAHAKAGHFKGLKEVTVVPNNDGYGPVKIYARIPNRLPYYRYVPTPGEAINILKGFPNAN